MMEERVKERGVMDSITRFLQKKLKLKGEHREERGDALFPSFFGFSFTWGKRPKRRISPKAKERLKQRIRKLTGRNEGIAPGTDDSRT